MAQSTSRIADDDREPTPGGHRGFCGRHRPSQSSDAPDEYDLHLGLHQFHVPPDDVRKSVNALLAKRGLELIPYRINAQIGSPRSAIVVASGLRFSQTAEPDMGC
jgi:hypothetical protein